MSTSSDSKRLDEKVESGLPSRPSQASLGAASTPALATQVEDFESLLNSQKKALDDFESPSSAVDEDDDLSKELEELARSEALLREELARFSSPTQSAAPLTTQQHAHQTPDRQAPQQESTSVAEKPITSQPLTPTASRRNDSSPRQRAWSPPDMADEGPSTPLKSLPGQSPAPVPKLSPYRGGRFDRRAQSRDRLRPDEVGPSGGNEAEEVSPLAVDSVRDTDVNLDVPDIVRKTTLSTALSTPEEAVGTAQPRHPPPNVAPGDLSRIFADIAGTQDDVGTAPVAREQPDASEIQEGTMDEAATQVSSGIPRDEEEAATAEVPKAGVDSGERIDLPVASPAKNVKSLVSGKMPSPVSSSSNDSHGEREETVKGSWEVSSGAKIKIDNVEKTPTREAPFSSSTSSDEVSAPETVEGNRRRSPRSGMKRSRPASGKDGGDAIEQTEMTPTPGTRTDGGDTTSRVTSDEKEGETSVVNETSPTSSSDSAEKIDKLHASEIPMVEDQEEGGIQGSPFAKGTWQSSSRGSPSRGSKGTGEDDGAAALTQDGPMDSSPLAKGTWESSRRETVTPADEGENDGASTTSRSIQRGTVHGVAQEPGKLSSSENVAPEIVDAENDGLAISNGSDAYDPSTYMQGRPVVALFTQIQDEEKEEIQQEPSPSSTDSGFLSAVQTLEGDGVPFTSDSMSDREIDPTTDEIKPYTESGLTWRGGGSFDGKSSPGSDVIVDRVGSASSLQALSKVSSGDTLSKDGKVIPALSRPNHASHRDDQQPEPHTDISRQSLGELQPRGSGFSTSQTQSATVSNAILPSSSDELIHLLDREHKKKSGAAQVPCFLLCAMAAALIAAPAMLVLLFLVTNQEEPRSQPIPSSAPSFVLSSAPSLRARSDSPFAPSPAPSTRAPGVTTLVPSGPQPAPAVLGSSFPTVSPSTSSSSLTPPATTLVPSGPQPAPAVLESSFPTVSPSTTSRSLNPSVEPSTRSSPSPSEFLPNVELYRFLASESLDDGDALEDRSSPQFRAYLWLADNVDLDLYSDVRKLQRFALAVLYYSTEGERWSATSGWLSDTEECTWFSRSRSSMCDVENQVVQLELYYNNVAGTLPQEIALLSNSLERLNLAGGPQNAVRGSLPPELAQLTWLKTFNVHNNELTGSIPNEYRFLSNLEILDFGDNLLTGSVPDGIGQWTSVRTLDISSNLLEGTIPGAIGSATNLAMLRMDMNTFEGFVPESIGALVGLETLSFASNKLESIPTQIGLLRDLRFLSLDDNDFEGSLHTEFGRLVQLRGLSLALNAFSGNLPTELGELRMLNQLDLSRNNFSGSIPADIGRINSRLRVLRLDGNQLSGSLPDDFSHLNRINSVRIDDNDLTGFIPDAVCSVFNQTLPTLYADCEELVCPCCIFCCVDNAGCQCRFRGTDMEWKCF